MISAQNWKKWIRIIAYILGLGTLGTTPALLLEYGDFWVDETPQLAVEVTQEETETDIRDSIDADAWDEILRTSDLENQQATQTTRRQTQKRPEGYKNRPEPDAAYRVGCECMDAIKQTHTGRGACSGHGGVRYWIYKLPDEGLMRYPTWRHEEHPDSLNTNELYQLDSHRPDTTTNPSRYAPPNREFMEEIPASKKSSEQEADYEEDEAQTERNNHQETLHAVGYWGFYDAMIMLMVCVTVAFITHTLFKKR